MIQALSIPANASYLTYKHQPSATNNASPIPVNIKTPYTCKTGHAMRLKLCISPHPSRPFPLPQSLNMSNKVFAAVSKVVQSCHYDTKKHIRERFVISYRLVTAFTLHLHARRSSGTRKATHQTFSFPPEPPKDDPLESTALGAGETALACGFEPEIRIDEEAGVSFGRPVDDGPVLMGTEGADETSPEDGVEFGRVPVACAGFEVDGDADSESERVHEGEADAT